MDALRADHSPVATDAAAAETTTTSVVSRRLDAALVIVVVVGIVLRFWDLGHGHLSIDESYTALASRMPVADLVRHIDSTDPHPPLSYLIFQPVTSATTSTFWLRFVAALASSAAVVVMGWWQRRRGVAGVVATAVFALSAYQLAYGREMRMYAFLCLGGVVTAWAAERWLEESRRRWIAVAALAAVACAFLHATGVLVLIALLALPLARRDRSAWELRVAAVGGLLLFATAWGAHALRWRGEGSAYPKASLSWLGTSVNETIAAVPSNRWLVLPLIVGGGVLIVLRRDASSRVWLVLAGVPVGALYLASVRQGVLIPKSLMAYSWGSALALGAVVGGAWRRMAVLGVAALALVGLVVLPYTLRGLTNDEGAGGLLVALDRQVQSGDALAVTEHRQNIGDLLRWYRSVVPDTAMTVDESSIPDVVLLRPSTETPSGRIWLVTSGAPEAVEGYEPCGPVADVGGTYHLECLVPVQ